MMTDDDHIDKLARGVMACHRKKITLEAVQQAVETFWGVAEAMRPTTTDNPLTPPP
mgnify:CR=1 FL=1|jgi:hypothetical protein